MPSKFIILSCTIERMDELKSARKANFSSLYIIYARLLIIAKSIPNEANDDIISFSLSIELSC